MTAAVPDHDPPAVVRRVSRWGVSRPVWRNDLGGVTYLVEVRGVRRFVKWQPEHPEVSLEREWTKLQWAKSFTRVPTPLDIGSEGGCTYLVTAAIDGANAVHRGWTTRPEVAVTAVARGLRAFHDALPVPECPWTWSPEARVANAQARGMTVATGLRRAPPTDMAVVCHGDACCPNTLLGVDRRYLAHVDVGALGVADRWADIAVGAMSTRWNYGPGWEETFVRSYGVPPTTSACRTTRSCGTRPEDHPRRTTRRCVARVIATYRSTAPVRSSPK